MGARQKDWARRKRQELMAALGGQCAKCETQKDLEFDCITPQGDRHHRLDMARRMSFYIRQHQAKNLQVLCKWCNAEKSIGERSPHPLKRTFACH